MSNLEENHGVFGRVNPERVTTTMRNGKPYPPRVELPPGESQVTIDRGGSSTQDGTHLDLAITNTREGESIPLTPKSPMGMTETPRTNRPIPDGDVKGFVQAKARQSGKDSA